MLLRGSKTHQHEDERPIPGKHVLNTLQEIGFECDISYAAHIPFIHRLLPTKIRYFLMTLEAVPQTNYRTLLYIKTMTVKQHKSEFHDTPRVNTNKILKNCYLRCKISY